MNVVCCWISYEPGTINRAYWDQSLIEGLFDFSAWHPAGAFTFDHWTIDSPDSDWPQCDGIIAVVAARHNVDHMTVLNRDLGRYQWVVVVATGDEESRWRASDIVHPARRIWHMGARKGAPAVDVPLGSGYSPGFPDLVRHAAAPAPGRLDVFFCGQDTHPRRHEAIEAARKAVPESRRLILPTVEFLADGTADKGGLARESYAANMADAKIAICPSGPESVDSFRLYEALESGAFPIADGRTPTENMGDHWEYVFGGLVPFMVMDEWAPLPAVVEHVLQGWPANAARVQAFWLQHKRKLAYTMQHHISELSTIQPDYLTPDDKITVVVPTCPIPSHPDTWMIEEVVASIRVQLPRAEIVIVCDGVRPTMAHKQADYDEFLHRLTRLCQEWHNVVPVILDEWHHQAGATRKALELVTTPLMLFVEHDTPLTGEVDWPGLCRIVESGVVNMVRLHHETAIGPDHVHMALDPVELHVGQTDEDPEGVPIVRTTQWSQRPHLATTKFYRNKVMAQFPAGLPTTYIEWVMHGLATHGIEDGKEQTWERWKVAIYYPPGGNIQRSLHLDGRAGASTEDSVEAFKEMRERK